MKTHRFTIAGLMGLVLVVALGLTALRSNSEAWAGATFLVTAAILGVGVVGAICREGRARAWWVGFALFGWGVLALAIRPPFGWDELPTTFLFRRFQPRLKSGGFDSISIATGFGKFMSYLEPSIMVGHCLFALAFAAMGGLLCRWLFGGPEGAESVAPKPEPPAPRSWRRRPALVGLAALALALGAAPIGLVMAPESSAATALLFTWGLLGFAVVGAVCRRGKRRAACLGAAFLGIGVMALIFNDDPEDPNWPHAVADHALNRLRASFPRIASRVQPAPDETIALANDRILSTLRRPLSIHFPDETPLEDVLKYIKEATKGPDGRGLPIYVDPVGLQEAEKTMTSPVAIDLDGVQLRTSLRLMLRQLGMNYWVSGGVLIISYEDSWIWIPPAQLEPYLVVGHCLLALLAAWLGAALAPLASDP